jgi:hypothetical protein
MAKIETIGFGQNAGFKTAIRLLLDPETILKLCSPDLMLKRLVFRRPVIGLTTWLKNLTLPF